MMKYDSADAYTHPGTGVYKNKLGIRDAQELAVKEDKLVSARMHSIPAGSFDVEHVKGIHRHLFHPLYGWAGEYRSVPLAVGESRFAQPQYIGSEMDKLLASVDAREMKRKDGDAFIKRLAFYMTELNAIHPFRDGNGRTIRAYAYLLAQECGYHLDFQIVSRRDWVEAAIKGFGGDNTLLESLLSRCLFPLEYDHSATNPRS